MMNFRLFACGVAWAALDVAAALAHSGATGVVKERMDGMGVMGKAVKVIAPMMQGQASYDAEAIRNAAEDIGRHAGEALTKLFPEGSGNQPSEAKREIWLNWEKFSDLAEHLHLYSEGLALAADNGVAGGTVQMATSMMGGSAMMGATNMMGGQTSLMGLEELSGMPADSVFLMMSQTCSACHTLFRAEGK